MRWLVHPEESGLELIAWLQRRLPSAPSGYLRQLLRSGRVLVDGHPGLEHRVLGAGNQVGLPRSSRLLDLIQATPELRILHQTEHYLVVDKPAALPVHRTASGGDNLTDRVACYLELSGAGYRVAPVHRLDAGTSGPVLFGKGKKSLAVLSELFVAGQVTKQYLALAAGRLATTGRLATPVPSHGKAKPALTCWQRLRQWDDGCLLLVTLGSGRRHQIRTQLAAAGHPLAGDVRYRSPLLPDLGRMFLHHCRLSFSDPWSRRQIRIVSPLPATLGRLLANLPHTRPPE